MGYDKHIHAFKSSLSMVPSKDMLGGVIKHFTGSSRVIFCSMGKSSFICNKIVHSARSFGLDWNYLDASHAFHGDIGIVKKDDLLVFVSKSGETSETTHVAAHLGAHTRVSITSHNNSTLDSICESTIVIDIPDEGSPFGIAPMISTTLYLLVLHAILVETIEKKGIAIQDFAKNHPAGSIGNILKNACINKEIDD